MICPRWMLDDRGKPAISFGTSSPKDDPRLARAIEDAIKQDTRPAGYDAMILAGVIAATMFVIVAFVGVGKKLMGLPNAWLAGGMIAAIIVSGLTIFGIIMWYDPTGALARQRRAMVRVGRCGRCHYELKSDREADGCTLCPECGSAWRLEEPIT